MHAHAESVTRIEWTALTPRVPQGKAISDEKWAADYEARTKEQLAQLKNVEPMSITDIPMSLLESLLIEFPQE